MVVINYSDIVTDELMQGAIINDEYPGFKEDYLVLHCLLRKYKTNIITKHPGFDWSVFEIGTNCGTGTNIICNALPDYKVYTLDLPTDLAHISLQHPISEGKGDKVGSNCKFPFTQLRGDSMTFDYSKYNSYFYFIDGEHDQKHPQHEIGQAMLNGAHVIILHDADIKEVWAAIEANQNKYYELYRVTGTRIAFFLLRRDINLCIMKREIKEFLDKKEPSKDFTDGGIVTGPSNAYFGDDKPEQIIPIEKLQALLAKPKSKKK